MSEEREDVETKSSDSPEVYQQTKFMEWFEKAFPWLLVSGATLGLTLMIILPIIFFQEKTGDQLKAQSDLRLALLYTTGGAIAALGLLETYRKNTNDRTKANADINAALENQKHQTKVLKEQIRQFDENAFKERKAERRERYTKAVEQLGDEKAPVRMGGVYTLVGLVDEWLEEESIEKYEDRLKEGQVIINNLCAYIRSPFTLASRYDELSKDNPISEGIYKDNQQKFYSDKAELKAEADVRLSIIQEIHDRLQGPEENTPGTWSDFEYDFSGSTFFYPVDLTKSYYTKPVNFSGSIYKGEADFSGSIYEGEANFSNSAYEKGVIFSTFGSRSTYKGKADFSDSTYKGKANFSNSTYKRWANFSNSAYEKNVIFSTFGSRSTYEGEADFRGSTYKRWANFSNSTYQGWADFSDSTYQGWADFTGSTYEKNVIFSTSDSRSTYEGRADFNDSTYKSWANFSDSTYQALADFSDSTYQDVADFSDSTYQDVADFSCSTYQGEANFRRSTYQGEANFRRSTYQGEANFSRSTYRWADFSRSIFYSETYFGKDKYSNSSSCFTNRAPQFYDKTNHKNTLFGSHNNDFTVDIDKGYPINLNSEGLPLGCKILTSEQKEYLADKFQEIDETKNKLREAKDDEEKARLSDMLRPLYKELRKWREEATTVKAEDAAPEEKNN